MKLKREVPLHTSTHEKQLHKTREVVCVQRIKRFKIYCVFYMQRQGNWQICLWENKTDSNYSRFLCEY